MPKFMRGKNINLVKNIEEEREEETTMVEIFQTDDCEENIRPHEIKTAWANTAPIPHKRKLWMPKCRNSSHVKNIRESDEKGKESRPTKLLKTFFCCFSCTRAE
ncbi:uncharacterized protein LOC143781791 [Ranitomeya variabilis]|uniref:uncharacterized protein LOC143781791 n=1 Tax=Ranitomeya variabilis TaxID=490064 RepID=UPI004057611C